MAHNRRKLKPKAARTNQHRIDDALKKTNQTSQKQPRWRSWLISTLALTILLSSTGMIVGVGWISILYILNPEQISWLNEVLPKWAQIPLGKKDVSYTLPEIELTLSKQKRIAGESLSLDNQQKKLFLLPVFQKRNNCQSDCQELVELRVYALSKDLEFQFQQQKYYHLVTQLSVTGLTESFVESGLGENVPESETQEGSINLALTEIKAFENSTSPGFWFYLWGDSTQDNDNKTAYGRIVHYNPQNRSLQQILSWKNPNGTLPKWQEVTGGGAKELVIDQTVGLEPHLQVYQVKPSKLVSNSLLLEAINLKKPESEDFGYKNSLLLARNGLWTPADAWLTSLVKERKKPYPEAAQAQIDLIRLHSQFTKIQADQSWASPSQQVLTYLLDGRWEQALQVLIESPEKGKEIYTLLKTDKGKLWHRTTVALRLNPTRRAVLAWAYLIFAVQRGEDRADSWIEGQANITQETLPYLQGLFTKLDEQVNNPHVSQIVGGVKKITQVNNADWLLIDPQADFKITDKQVWYQVEVSAFHNGTSWLSYPFSDLRLPKTQTSQFWTRVLGMRTDNSIQIVVWGSNGEQQINAATIKAVQMRGGVLRLLAVGDSIPQNENSSIQPKPLALTSAALEWVQPSPIAIQELNRQNPQGLQAILPNVWRALQQSGDIPSGQVLSLEKMKAQMGSWPVQMVDVTNDGNLDVVLTISGSAIASLTQPENENLGNEDDKIRPRTLIFRANGKIIYNDFISKSEQNLTAIAKLSSDQSLALLVESANTYNLKRWSETNQRFE
ncbi:hypothetical protein ACSQ6I_09495 [Anabaena sp. WFMT]|uniref:hypothetical protein n=1 Tax=Anabaena sp. WFMT TaxID=3449730 RepID=UPI003F200B9B